MVVVILCRGEQRSKSKHFASWTNFCFSLCAEKIEETKRYTYSRNPSFSKVLQTIYDRLNLSRTVYYAAKTLKEKLLEKIPTSKFPPFVTDKYLFALYFKIKFPPLPSSELALALRPPYPKWFVCGSWMAMKQNLIKKKAKQITTTKHDIYKFRGQLYFGLHQVRITFPIGIGKSFSLTLQDNNYHFYLTQKITCFFECFKLYLYNQCRKLTHE